MALATVPLYAKEEDKETDPEITGFVDLRNMKDEDRLRLALDLLDDLADKMNWRIEVRRLVGKLNAAW